MLNQIFVPRPFAARRADEFVHHIPLMVAREDQRFLAELPPLPIFALLDLQVYVAAQNRQQVGWHQHLVPQVIGGVLIHILGCIVARTAILGALVKRQEYGVRTFETRGHIHLVLAHGEMHQRTTLEGQQRFSFLGDRINRQARGFVLMNGVVHRLLEFGFQLQRCDRQTVDEQHQIDAPRLRLAARLQQMFIASPRRIHQLRHHAAAVLRVAGKRVGVQIMLGFELAQAEAHTSVTQLMAQHAQRAKGAHLAVRRIGVGFVQLLGNPLQQFLLRVVRVELAELLPLRVLRFLHKTDEIFRIKCQRAVVMLGLSQQPALRQQVFDHVVLKCQLRGDIGHCNLPVAFFL